MKTVNLPVPIIVAAAVLLVSGCFMTLEERWQAFDKKMRQEGGGSILNISTVGGLKAIPRRESSCSLRRWRCTMRNSIRPG